MNTREHLLYVLNAERDRLCLLSKHFICCLKTLQSKNKSYVLYGYKCQGRSTWNTDWRISGSPYTWPWSVNLLNPPYFSLLLLLCARPFLPFSLLPLHPSISLPVSTLTSGSVKQAQKLLLHSNPGATHTHTHTTYTSHFPVHMHSKDLIKEQSTRPANLIPLLMTLTVISNLAVFMNLLPAWSIFPHASTRDFHEFPYSVVI